MYEKPVITTYTADALQKLIALCASCRDGCYCHSDAPGDYGQSG